MFRSLRPHQLIVDIIIPAVGFLLLLPWYLGELGPNLLVGVGMASALGFRRLSPTLALGLAWIVCLLQVAFGIEPDPSNLAILPILYGTAAYGLSAVKWAGLVSSFLGALIVAIYIPIRTYLTLFPPGDVVSAVFYDVAGAAVVLFFSCLAAFALSWTLGLLAKTWRTAREAGQARLEEERRRLDAQQSAIVEAERGRIARDMHDVVAHSLAVVIAQADGASYARKSDPDAVDSALHTISAVAREALGDVRILLGQLRHAEPDVPQPALADLDGLLDKMRDSGLDVSLKISGTPVPLGGGAQLAVYRIVQEALTNALRHGDRGKAVVVQFDWTDLALTLSVSSALRDDAPHDGMAIHAGHGLVGMKERAVLAGGRLTAGPETGRFVVTATLPAMTAEVGA